MTLCEISASTRSWLMSLGASFERCDISVNVFVRSTSESRPSSAESRSMERWYLAGEAGSLVGVLGADSIEGTCGARSERAG
jgi:hypothetical protein